MPKKRKIYHERNEDFDINRNQTTIFNDFICGFPHDWELAGPDGAHYHIWLKEKPTKEFLNKAYSDISAQQDIVSLSWDLIPEGHEWRNL